MEGRTRREGEMRVKTNVECEQREQNGGQKERRSKSSPLRRGDGEPDRLGMGIIHTHTDTHTVCSHVDGHTRTCSTHSVLHRAVYLLMRLFKYAVGGRALNHLQASLKENCGVRGFLGGGVFVKQHWLHAASYTLHLNISLAVRRVWRTHTE